jgi:glycosyltransferase involved in cell wall biosynthesis
MWWPKVSVVVPVLNEERNLPEFARRLPPDIHELIVVDGRSSDRTVELAEQLWPDARIITQTRHGKGNALACGFEASTGDVIVMIDADGSTDPREMYAFVATLVGGADFAKGSRFACGAASEDITLLRRVGNRALIGLTNLLYRTRYTDLCYGYNAFWRPCLDELGLPATRASETRWGDGFEIETVINVRAASSGLIMREVASFEQSRVHGVSNLNALRDGLRVLATIFKEWRLGHQTESAEPHPVIRLPQ